jgi:3-oxoacyl-[acyl-carrier protein] reductase
VLDEGAVDAHADVVAARSGDFDVAVNAVGIMHVQHTARRALWRTTSIRWAANRGRTSSRRRPRPGMWCRGVRASSCRSRARMVTPGIRGFGVAGTAIEALSRLLAAELGPAAVRVVWLRPDATPEAAAELEVLRVGAPVLPLAGPVCGRGFGSRRPS